jgi:hypothetical protein
VVVVGASVVVVVVVAGEQRHPARHSRRAPSGELGGQVSDPTGSHSSPASRIPLPHTGTGEVVVVVVGVSVVVVVGAWVVVVVVGAAVVVVVGASVVVVVGAVVVVDAGAVVVVVVVSQLESSSRQSTHLTQSSCGGMMLAPVQLSNGVTSRTSATGG